MKPARLPYCYINQRSYLNSTTLIRINSGYRLLFSRTLLFMGIIILIWVAYPILKFQLINSRQMAYKQFVSPGGNIIQPDNQTSVTGDKLDYTQASNWFPEVDLPVSSIPISEYTLSIPKLKIKTAKVSLNGEDLSKSLIHYGGTTLPGRKGNGVIFGHSILPQFFNPKNYTAIFSTLHTLETGDQILLDYDQITYQYQVVDMFEVTPEDISVLDQTYDSEYITLITCTPPGTSLRRLIVKAKLVPYQSEI